MMVMMLDIRSLVLIIFASALLSCSSQAAILPHDGRSSGGALQTRGNGQTGKTRTVTLVADVSNVRHLDPESSSRYLSGTHSFIEFGATDVDGPLRTEIGAQDAGTINETGLLRVLDRGVAAQGFSANPAGRRGSTRHVSPLGLTTVTNDELMDPRTAQGILLEVWNIDPIYKLGNNEEYNGCNAYVERVLRRVLGDEALDAKLKELPETERVLRDGQLYGRLAGERIAYRITTAAHQYQPGKAGLSGPNYETRFHFLAPDDVIITDSNRPAGFFSPDQVWDDPRKGPRTRPNPAAATQPPPTPSVPQDILPVPSLPPNFPIPKDIEAPHARRRAPLPRHRLPLARGLLVRALRGAGQARAGRRPDDARVAAAARRAGPGLSVCRQRQRWDR